MRSILTLLILIIVLVAGCGEQDVKDEVKEPLYKETTGKLGLWINPSHGDMEYYDEALDTAREAGIQVAHLYVQWGLVETSSGEYDWSIPDYILSRFNQYGFEAVVVMPVIFTTKLDVTPKDVIVTDFSDPQFVQRFVQFTTVFMDRYSDTVKYLVIGNEIDIYLVSHPDQASDFRKLVQAVADAHEVIVGTEFAIHTVVQNKSFDIARKALAGDMVFFTFYPAEENFSFGGEVESVEQYYDAMFDLAGSKKIAVVETSWSSSRLLDSSEQTQAEYVTQIFRILEKHKERIEFLMWINLYDSKEEECMKAARFFVEGVNDDVLQDAEFMERFSTFMCSMGLRRTDGTPKPAWYEWVEQVTTYYGTEPTYLFTV